MDLWFIVSVLSRTAFNIGGLSVQWYGVILTSAMLIGLLLMTVLGKQKGYTSDDMLELFLWIIPFAVIFSRIVYVIVRPNPDDGYFPVESWGFKELADGYTQPHSFVNLFAIWEGGITIIGGVIGGILGGLIFIKKHKANIRRLFDICMPVLLLCQAIGRWGNYVNQEAYGSLITNPDWQWFPFAVFIERMHGYYAATFFYAFVWNIAGAILIYLLVRKAKVEGLSVFMYLAWYCTKRFFMEFIRADAVITDGGVPLTQVFMAICAVTGIAGGILFYRRGLNKLHHEAVRREVENYIAMEE